jgi:RNA polymerase sigma-70 factor, ECF subfamily
LANSEEQQWLDAVAQGDMAVFERIYRMHKDDLLTASDFLLGGDRSAAEDVLHDVFVSLARRAGEIKLTGSLRNYLLTSCLNRARDLLRQRNREATSEAPISGHSHTLMYETAKGEENEIGRLTHALQSLPVEQREIVTLHIYGGLKFREIAEMLELSINTAQSRYRYALEALRRAMNPQTTDRN